MTVDPIRTEDTKILASEPGTVVVAKGKKGYRTFLDDKGPTFGERMFGDFQKYYLVDIGRKDITDTFEAPSKKGALPFKLTVRYTLAVDKARANDVVRDGIRDLSKVFSDDLRRHLRAKALECEVDEINAARRELEAALNKFVPDDDRFNFRPGLVEVSLDAETARKLHDIDSENINLKHGDAVAHVADKEVDRHYAMMKDVDRVLAAYQASGDPKYFETFKIKIADTARDRSERLLLLGKLIEHNVIEGFDIPQDLIKDLVASHVAGMKLAAPEKQADRPALADDQSKTIVIEPKKPDS